jgi:hypothetical protein
MPARHRSRLAPLAVAAVLVLLGACGGGDDGDDVADAAEPAAEQTNAPGAGQDNPLSGDDVDAALEAAGIEGVADALAFATKAERYEVDGNTVHLYLGEESQLRGETACIAATAVLAEDHNAVIHDDGQEFPC